MTVILVDAACAIGVAAGLVVAFGPGTRGAGSSENPRIYVRRIAGMMLAAFALAIGAMVTAFHFA